MKEVRDAPVAHRLRQINTAFWKYSTNPPRLAPLERREDWVFELLYSASTVEALTSERDALLSRVERLEKALKPFAEASVVYDGIPVSEILPQQTWFTPQSLREARAALKETQP